MNSHTSRAAPSPPAPPGPGRSGRVVAHLARLARLEFLPRKQFGERACLVGGSLAQQLNAKFPGAALDHARAARGDHSHCNAAFAQQFDALSVARIERLHLFTAVREIKPPVGEHAVDVENHELDAPRTLGRIRAHAQMTFALNRSCVFSAPVSL